ncbi:homocysteine S-methyltransferase [Alkalicoccus daliensis]|uniref:S-methylmethionine:homocysteine methyltransferase n=2 Tax=Alkalicoccus daliensis TaxID=745820 RepID=A0A1H0GYB6_9BACI|nr:homocysteine S-methyltransferase [Alkalicoccus daliensis]
MMNPLEKMLESQPVIILDGALATELEKQGCDLNDDLWSAKVLAQEPEKIKQVHRNYFNAGADCAITASYQASMEGFLKKGYSLSEASNLIRKSVVLAAEARDEFWSGKDNRLDRSKPIIAGSAGPYGAYLADGSEYKGNYGVSKEELKNFHRPRVELLVEAGADILALETVPSLLEVQAFVEVLHEFPGKYAWISFSAKDGKHINEGTGIGECAAWLDSFEQVAAVGVNCTPLQYVSSLIKEIKPHTDKPVIVYPNSGEIYNAAENKWEGASLQENFNSQAKIWYEQGAQLIGGCCRTGPEEIKDLAAWGRKKE